MVETLTFRKLTARPVLLELERPVTARIATITDWPLILIDIETEEGVPGRAYLEPYVPKAMKYLVPALHDMSDMLAGQPLAPGRGRKRGGAVLRGPRPCRDPVCGRPH